jgi:uncharacterized membrane protein YkoI
MNKPSSTYALVAATVVCLGGAAHAEAATSREAQALASATVSIVNAVDIGEKQGKGKTVGAEFDIEKGLPIWEVRILGAEGVTELKVDANSGQVVMIEDEHVRGKLTNFVTGTNLKDLESVKTTFAEAVAIAEQLAKGKTVKVEVEHEHEHDHVQFDVFLRSGDVTKKFKIDALSGKLL